MEKILTQEEIDALFRVALAGTAKGAREPRPARQVARCDFRAAGLISREQVRLVNMLHETFARNLTRSLGAYLRVLFEVSVLSVEQLSYAEFLQRIPEIAYMASVSLRPLEALAVVQIDLPLAFPVIDLLLGGPGKTEGEVREITEIEEQILESVVKIICGELQNSWEPVLDLKFHFGERQRRAQILRLMSPNEKTLALSFETRMPQVRGLLNLAFPAVVANALLRRLSQHWSSRHPQGSLDSGGRLWERLQDCRFSLELVLPGGPVRVRDLLALEPRQVLVLPYRVGQPALLSVAGKRLFAAHPVRSGNMRGGQIRQRLNGPEGPQKESP